MRIINKNHIHKSVVITAICIAVIGGVASALFIPTSPFALNKAKNDQPENTVNYDKATEDQKNAGNKAKEDFINKHDSDGSEDQPDQPPTSSNVALTITSTSQQDDMLQIRSMIETTSAGGTCKLTLTREGSSAVTQEAGVQVTGSYSVCEGFNVPVNELAKGSWNVKIEYLNGSSSGTAERKVDVI